MNNGRRSTGTDTVSNVDSIQCKQIDVSNINQFRVNEKHLIKSGDFVKTYSGGEDCSKPI